MFHRRVYFDTRFELDVDIDADGNGTDMGYVDGGIRADQYAFGFGSSDYEEAEWDARVKRPNTSGESHYYDFLVNCPASAVQNKPDYRGMVAYGRFEVRIYQARYILWETTTNQPVAIYNAPSGSTDGWHNIGMQTNVGVFIDGVFTGMTGIALGNNPKARFGSATVYDTLNPTSNHSAGIQLIENLCYLRSYNRSASGGGIPSGAPRVTVTSFDGPQFVTMLEVYGGNNPVAYLAVDSEGGPDRNARFFNSDDPDNQYRESELYLTTGRRVTGQVIKNNADGYVSEGAGAPFVADPEVSQPGVAMTMHTDAVGATRAYNREANYITPIKGGWTGDITNDYTSTYDYFGISLGWRTRGHATTDGGLPLSSGATYQGEVTVGYSTGPSNATCGHSYCEVNVSQAGITVSMYNIETGNYIDLIYGDEVDEREGIDTVPRNDPKEYVTITLMNGDVNFLYIKYTDPDTGKTRYFKPIGKNPTSTATFWPDPSNPVDWYGDKIDVSKYEVDQAEVDKVKDLQKMLKSPCAIKVSPGVYKTFAQLGALFGSFDEIDMLVMAYITGEITQEQWIALGIGAVAIVTGFGIGALIKKLKKLKDANKKAAKAIKEAEEELAKAQAAAAKTAKKALNKSKLKNSIPQDAQDALKHIKGKGTKFPGTKKGGSKFKNRDSKLPGKDTSGKDITYKEWDINPPGPKGRNAKRIITGSDGKSYYTDDHYDTFTEVTDLTG